MASNGYARIGGVNAGVKLVDINPNKSNQYPLNIFVASNNQVTYLPIQGYSKIAFKKDTENATLAYQFEKIDHTTIGSTINIPASWTSYVTIPSDAVFIKIIGTYLSLNHEYLYYSLLA